MKNPIADFTTFENLEEARNKFISLAEYWGFEPQTYSTWGKLRADLNKVVANANSENTIENFESALTFIDKLNNHFNRPINVLEELSEGSNTNIVIDLEDKDTLYSSLNSAYNVYVNTDAISDGDNTALILDKSFIRNRSFSEYLNLQSELLSTTSLTDLTIGFLAGAEYYVNFIDEEFRVDGQTSTFDSALVHARSGNAMMVDETGTLVWAPHNLQIYSDNLASYTVESGTAILDQDDFLGGSSAALYTLDDGTFTSNRLGLFKNSVANPDQTISAVFKSSGMRYAALGSTNGAGYTITATFDLDNNGAVASVSGHPDTHSDLLAWSKNLGNGWFLCTLHIVDMGGVGRNWYGGSTQPGSGTHKRNLVGDGSSGIYICFPHVFRSDLGGMAPVPEHRRVHPSLTHYVPTEGTAVYLPREHHHVYEGGEWIDAGCLLEPQGTNIEENSISLQEYDANASSATFSEMILGQTDPFGGTDAGLLAGNGNNRSHYTYGVLPSNASTKTFSVWLRAGTSTEARIQIGASSTEQGVYADVDLANGTISAAVYKGGAFAIAGKPSIEDWGNGWYRASVTAETPSSEHVGYVTFPTHGHTDNYYIYGPQLEEGSVPTTYIPTSGSQVTRAADTLEAPASALPWPKGTGPELFDMSAGVVNVDNGAPNWEFSNGQWSISASGSANLDYVSFTDILTSGNTYEIVIGYENISGDIRVAHPDATGPHVTGSFGLPAGTGSQTVVFTAASSDLFFRVKSQNSGGTITSCSVREVDPYGVSIAWRGRVSYADTGASLDTRFFQRRDSFDNDLDARLTTLTTRTGQIQATMRNGSTARVISQSTETMYSPGLNVLVSIAARYTSSAVQVAADGEANATGAVTNGVPNLSAVPMTLTATPIVPTSLEQLVVWATDIGKYGIETVSAQ